MNSMKALTRAVAMTSVAVLAGCASGGGSAPIEDRETAAAAVAAPAVAPPAAAAVRAIPLPARPVPEPLLLPDTEADELGEPGLAPEPAAPSLALSEPLVEPGVPAPSPPSAVQSLLDAATSAGEQGEWDRAQATLERALKLAPGDPSVWTQLAYTHFRQGHFDQAREMADRGLAVSTAGGPEQAALWQLIADVEMARGNVDAAQAARARALGD